MTGLLTLRIDAESGDPRAQVELALELLIGKEIRQSPQEAMHWVNAACLQNYADAFLLHAALAILGFGRPANIDESYALLSRAAALGSVRAQGQLAVLGGPDGFNYAAWNTAAPITPRFDAPRIYTIENFMPKQACKWLTSQIRKRLQRASIYTASGEVAAEAARTNSSGAFHALEFDVVVQLVKLRMAQLTGVPVAHQEPTQILHYERGQEFTPHYDFLHGDHLKTRANELDLIGQRVGTLLIYLNENYEGGETAFPRLDWRFKGKTGDALLFWNVSQDGEVEPDLLHAGVRVQQGQKWILSQWMRALPVPLLWRS